MPHLLALAAPQTVQGLDAVATGAGVFLATLLTIGSLVLPLR